MNSSVYLPERIKVGFQNRSDTYTKKLAFVVCIDEKGKIRKERSWEGWRDKKIEPVEYKNEPMSGFVLNKKVGGYKSDWNFRQAYVRVYDPRDFEFEITIPNLLFILENTNSIVGKGLEGEFVYGWHGKDLLLIPAASALYAEQKAFTKKVQAAKRFKTDELIPGMIYSDKNDERYVFINKFGKGAYRTFLFYRLDKEPSFVHYKFIQKKNPSFIIAQEGDQPYEQFAYLMDFYKEVEDTQSPIVSQEFVRLTTFDKDKINELDEQCRKIAKYDKLLIGGIHGYYYNNYYDNVRMILYVDLGKIPDLDLRYLNCSATIDGNRLQSVNPLDKSDQSCDYSDCVFTLYTYNRHEKVFHSWQKWSREDLTLPSLFKKYPVYYVRHLRANGKEVVGGRYIKF